MYDVIVVDEVHERHMMGKKDCVYIKCMCTNSNFMHTLSLGDFLLALLKKTLAQRDDLYVVLMSATINIDLFAEYFDAPTLMVKTKIGAISTMIQFVLTFFIYYKIPGKMYPVKIHYWPQGDEDKNLIDEAAYKKRQNSLIKVCRCAINLILYALLICY
jgi:HrpA-like RNA helicase